MPGFYKKKRFACDRRGFSSALDALLEDKSVAADQKPSIGCNIKLRTGKEPYYFIVPKG